MVMLSGMTGRTGSTGVGSLQATLAACSSNSSYKMVVPHHPITCNSELRFDEDGMFSCEHINMPADDERTQACLIHSVACLLIELASQL